MKRRIEDSDLRNFSKLPIHYFNTRKLCLIVQRRKNRKARKRFSNERGDANRLPKFQASMHKPVADNRNFGQG